jgi:phage terminase large subunit-like protein
MATDKKQMVREAAENDLRVFAKLVNPHRVYGQIHLDTFKWWMDMKDEGVDNTVLLLPRDHQKSHCAAVKAAWQITKTPDCTILYVSATSGLAEKQLKAIKDILLCKAYRYYWPEMVNAEEGKRERWTNTEICVDHPLRKKESVRDSTVFAAGLTTNITGFHATDVYLDDMVVPNNAYTEEGRRKVAQQYSQLASIETTGATETVVGTVYHPADIYKELEMMMIPTFNEEGDITGEEELYRFKSEVVEEDGIFLWPKEMRDDGKFYGFDQKILAIKRAKYIDKTQYYAQYYLQTNDSSSHRLTSDKFQYFDPKYVRKEGMSWFFKGKKLNIYAGIDFAFSLNKKADYTAIVVIGIDSDGYIYVLDISRFKADKITLYFDEIMELHQKWEFKKLRAEVSVAQQIIVNDIKDMFRVNGTSISVDEHRPTRHEGSKEERIAAALEIRYENKVMWHFKGGWTSVLEEELMLARPPHDDIKDCLASVVEIAKAPKAIRERRPENNVVEFSNRFGGVRFK